MAYIVRPHAVPGPIWVKMKTDKGPQRLNSRDSAPRFRAGLAGPILTALLLAWALPAAGQAPPVCEPLAWTSREPHGIRFQYHASAAAETSCVEGGMLLVWPADGRLDEPPDPGAAGMFALGFDPGAWSSSLAIRPAIEPAVQAGFDWSAAFRDSFLFLAVQHSFRLGTEPDTRKKLDGKFFRDWMGSIRSVSGWRDGDNFVTNYVAHPMQGAVTGFIQVQNDPRGRDMTFTPNKEYFKSRAKAMLWSAVWSTQFEMGPVSEATLGNVGYKSQQKRYSSAAYVDLVITPTLGTAWLVGEDALDRYFISKWEVRTKNRVMRVALRSIFNPSRSFANMMRGRWPWHRDTRAANP